jgi:uncharacterized protein
MMVSAEENLVTKMHIPDSARPPALKPGAVIHGPETDTDSLLAGFALELRRRGFRVGGIVQRNLRAAPDCTCEMELVDLATDETIPISQQLGKGSTACRVDPAGMAEAAGRLRQALDSRPDLVVVNKFGGLEKTGGGLAQELLWAMAEGLPVLTSVSVRFLDEWLAFCGGHCELLAPQEPALWRWWGPQRLYEDLLLGLADGPVRRIARGAHWLLVQGPEGTGLARLPRGSDAQDRDLAAYQTRGLADLAGLARSWDPFETALGMAAINAHYNRPDLYGTTENGLEVFAEENGRVVAIGAFPNIAERLPDALVIDARPGPDDYPAPAADWLLPGCDAAVMTAATLGNRTLPRLLDLARGSRIALIGPGTPLTPRLFDYGIEVLAGFVADDPERLARCVEEGGSPRQFAQFGRPLTLRR